VGAVEPNDCVRDRRGKFAAVARICVGGGDRVSLPASAEWRPGGAEAKAREPGGRSFRSDPPYLLSPFLCARVSKVALQ
jgi:hypothetical protein